MKSNPIVNNLKKKNEKKNDEEFIYFDNNYIYCNVYR